MVPPVLVAEAVTRVTVEVTTFPPASITSITGCVVKLTRFTLVAAIEVLFLKAAGAPGVSTTVAVPLAELGLLMLAVRVLDPAVVTRFTPVNLATPAEATAVLLVIPVALSVTVAFEPEPTDTRFPAES